MLFHCSSVYDENPTLSIVLPVATALVRKHLLVSDDDPKIVLDLKGAIAAKLNSHLCDLDRHSTMLQASVLTLVTRSRGFSLLVNVQECMLICRLQQVVSVQLEMLMIMQPHPKRHKGESGHDLLEFSESSSSNGSSPFVESDLSDELKRL